jgi:hypothetical protein
MQFGSKFTRRRSSSHHNKGQQPSFLGFRDSRHGSFFKRINNIVSNASGMPQCLQKENPIAFDNGRNSKRIGLDADGNDQFVVFHFKYIIVDTLHDEFLLVGMEFPGFGVQEFSAGTEDGSHGFLDASKLEGSDRRGGKQGSEEKVVVGGNDGQALVGIQVEGQLESSPSTAQDDDAFVGGKDRGCGAVEECSGSEHDGGVGWLGGAVVWDERRIWAWSKLSSKVTMHAWTEDTISLNRVGSLYESGEVSGS